MKKCADCKWSRIISHDKKLAMCVAPQNIAPNYTGFEEVRYRYDYCSTQREDGFLGAIMTNSCGKLARWWAAAS